MLTTRALVPQDMNWFGVAIYEHAGSYRFATHGRTLAPDAVNAMLWSGVAVHTVVASEGRPIALLQLSSTDLQNGVADFDLLVDRGDPAELAVVVESFLESASSDFPLRKVYTRVTATDAEIIVPALGNTFTEEGRYTDHVRVDRHSFVDLIVLAHWFTSPASVTHD